MNRILFFPLEEILKPIQEEFTNLFYCAGGKPKPQAWWFSRPWLPASFPVTSCHVIPPSRSCVPARRECSCWAGCPPCVSSEQSLPKELVTQTGKRWEENQRGFEDFRGWRKDQKCNLSLGVQRINSHVCYIPTGISSRGPGFVLVVGCSCAGTQQKGQVLHFRHSRWCCACVGFAAGRSKGPTWGQDPSATPEEWQPHGVLGLLESRWQEGEPLGKKTILIRNAWCF